eukprot:TRINITY_DN1540_c0_g1_i1.p1 TRINITY_DN1540_c0_g1~~TRINITY_DN1540_c0_g1_i1.p1  ORF type:complete len:252 (-),score=33.26 TRINITY_DN1540_c0_g1_i1:46-801(-)
MAVVVLPHGGAAAAVAPLTKDLHLEPLQSECPICLDAFERPCRAACGHWYCYECIINTMRAEAPRKSGRCPMCRARVSVFSIIEMATGEPLQRPEPRSIFGQFFVQGNIHGLASYHFEREDYCYISYSSALCLMWPRLDDGRRPPCRKQFVDVSWDPYEHVFRGTIDWSPTTWQGDRRWEYEMEFSEDLEEIIGGGLVAYGPPETGQIHGPRRQTVRFGSEPRYRRQHSHAFASRARSLLCCWPGPGCFQT